MESDKATYLKRPLITWLAFLFNLAGGSVIVWLYAGFEYTSGMEGMVDGLLEFLCGIISSALGLVMILLALVRRERVIGISFVNYMYGLLFLAFIYLHARS